MTTSPATPPIDFTRCINLVEIASGPDEWKYGLHPEHVARGWVWRIEHMRKVANLGCKHHILHLPFGRLVGVHTFAFDMASVLLESGDARYTQLVSTFASALRPLVREGHTIEVYAGSLQGSAGMINLKAPAGGKRDDYLRRLATNLKPFLDLGCRRIWGDASALIRPGDAEYGVIQWTRGVGVEFGIEAWPVDADHFAGYPIFAVEQDYQNQKVYPGALARAKAGPIVRSVNKFPAGERPKAVAAILADGDVPAIDVLNAGV